ncbi:MULTISPECIES: ABC transporter ATP-binding protein [Rhizobium]|uniref:ABC transporter ATP-binding protein n=1 Tax=Rhizobium rhododendri TaxID=2506430 RepID=A0ABY8ISE4_9HYPH|nr:MULTISPECIES: ABC transporter ATP-binding protein [Rhizobium]MBO9170826.1 ABC transporter ATP-binding protein [Rhizobium sp. L245/93]MBZ5762508.1 ABC transporter ATP-binding protein [Rhizobium sp. VS19-DR96]MBZ5768477.1 ABC transporter ATP-binding protein [Rhizobium sp. VS19-DR129.2]MBZ5775995.1 ABC transporter ATP-binding protein [Rhizobium sp. VS19-DRK62.2]MBZ5787233.1 ABC transporter ATP-binding protein [Rhizobium sp. VS19-DR121]
MAYAIEMSGVTKRFGPQTANSDVNLAVRKGEIHALVGENGAGKTTLMNVLFGLYQPDAGVLSIDGEPVVMDSPRKAIALGLGMVHQHFKLVPSLTVAENIFLGMEITKGGLIDRKAQSARVRELSTAFGLQVDPDRRVAELSVGIEQRVEILKVLARGAKIVILDEPTAVLTPQESRDLFRILRSFTEKGMTVIFISHHLSEVMEVSDTITVLRDGRVVGTRPTSEVSEDELVRMMVGRAVNFDRRPRGAVTGEPVLDLREVCARDDRGLPTLSDINFKVRAGEIIGIVGVDGNGQTELAEVISGLRQPSHGVIQLCQTPVQGQDPLTVRIAGLSHVPGNRLVRGVDASASIASNILMGRQHSAPFAKCGFIRWTHVKQQAERLIKQFDIRATGHRAAVRTLSGGNMQKVVLAREFSRGAPFLLIDQPTRGVDIGAMEGIHDEIIRQRQIGAAILLISVQLDEVLKLADRILVMFAGRIVGEVDPDNTTEDEIGFLMAGRQAGEMKVAS